MRRHLKKDKRGLSNIIVVVLSLIIIVVIVANVILWSYQMNQLDWERMQENVSIENVVPATASYNPSGYALGGSTTKISGSLSDMILNDGVYMSFRSYYSGTDTSDFVDSDISNVDPSTDKGTHSNFTAQRYGPDATYDTLTEVNTGTRKVNESQNFVDGQSDVDNSTDKGTHSSFIAMQSGPDAIYDTLAEGASYVQVTFVAAGTGSGVTGNPTPAYPSGLQADDLIILQVTVRNTATTPTTPTGFTLLYGPDSTGTGRQWIYNKFSDGTESGTITVTIGGTVCKMARMYAFRNVALSNFNEGGGFGSGTGATISAQSVTTTDVKRLVVSFVLVNDDNAVGSFTGETGGDWTEAVAEFTTTAGSDGCVQLQTATMALAGTILGGSYVMSAADSWGVRTLALKPKPNYELDLEVQWTTADYQRTHEYLCIKSGSANWGGTLKVDVRSGSSWVTLIASLTSNSWKNVSVSDYLTSATFTIRFIDTSATTTQDKWDIDCVLLWTYNYDINYELDLEEKWTNVTHDLPNADLCIFGGTMGLEDIRVDVWNGAAWNNVFTDLTNGWNNASVSSYLVSSTFTIRFKGGTETGDTTPDSWHIDVTLLHVWSDSYMLEVEFTGSSSTDYWSQLMWTIDSTWTTGSVSVTLQLYDYTLGTLGAYPISGDGCISYTSSATPNTDETKNQTIVINPTHFRDASGNWRIKIKGAKSTSEQFDSKIDLVTFRPEISGVHFTFKNKGASTSHIVSLWIINSTYHQRYSVDIFLNSGNTLSYFRADISLPSGQYVVKVVTDRGNAAVYSEG